MVLYHFLSLSEPVFPTLKMGALQFLSHADVTAMNSDNIRKGSRTGQPRPAPSSPSPKSGKAIASSFGRNILDVWLLTYQFTEASLLGDTTSVLSQTGEFARLQVSEAGTWCVDPASGEGVPPGKNSSAQCEYWPFRITLQPPPREHEVRSPKSWLHVPAWPFQSCESL